MRSSSLDVPAQRPAVRTSFEGGRSLLGRLPGAYELLSHAVELHVAALRDPAQDREGLVGAKGESFHHDPLSLADDGAAGDRQLEMLGGFAETGYQWPGGTTFTVGMPPPARAITATATSSVGLLSR